MRMLDEDDRSNDVEVSWADQQKINQFSRLNQRQTDAQAELDDLRTEKEQLEEVLEEVQMMEMTEDFDEDLGGEGEEDDDDGLEEEKERKATTKGHLIPFKVGDAFVHVTLEKASELLEQEQGRVDKAIAQAEESLESCEKEMKGLKVDLYAKFGSNINLERE